MYFLIGLIISSCVLVGQLRNKPLTGRLYRLPSALILFSVYALLQLPEISAADWIILILSPTLSLGFGLVLGRYTQLSNHDGAWYLSGSMIAVLISLLSIPARYLIQHVTTDTFGMAPAMMDSSAYIVYFLSIGSFVLGRYTMLLCRYPLLLRHVGENEENLRRLREAR